MSPNVVFLEEPEDTGIAGEVAGSRFREVLLFVPVLYFNSDSLSEREPWLIEFDEDISTTRDFVGNKLNVH